MINYAYLLHRYKSSTESKWKNKWMNERMNELDIVSADAAKCSVTVGKSRMHIGQWQAMSSQTCPNFKTNNKWKMPRLQHRWWSCRLVLQYWQPHITDTAHLSSRDDCVSSEMTDVSPVVNRESLRRDAQSAAGTPRPKTRHLPESFRRFLVAWHNHLQRFREVFSQRRLGGVSRQVANVEQAIEWRAWNKSTAVYTVVSSLMTMDDSVTQSVSQCSPQAARTASCSVFSDRQPP